MLSALALIIRRIKRSLTKCPCGCALETKIVEKRKKLESQVWAILLFRLRRKGRQERMRKYRRKEDKETKGGVFSHF